MKINSTFTKLMMVAAFGLLLQSCTTDDNELLQEKSVTPEVELTFESQAKVGDSTLVEGEPIIVRPRG